MSADKFQPTWATKPKPTATAPAPAAAPYPADPAPASKPIQYGAPAPASILYRPHRPSSPPRPPRRRRFCCSCILFTSLFLLTLLLLAAITAAIFYAIYRPHRPDFTLSSLHLTSLNLSSSAAFTSALSLSLSSHNPNSKLSFSYDPFSVSVLSSSIPIAAGKISPFLHPAKNTTHLTASATSKGLSLRAADVSDLKAALKKQKGLDLVILMDTKARIGVGKSKSGKVRVRVSCTGIKANADSKGKFSSTVKTSGVNCKAKMRFKIWKWNLSW